VDTLGATVLAMPGGTPASREVWWTKALERIEPRWSGSTRRWPRLLRAHPLGVEQISLALEAALRPAVVDAFSTIEKACLAMTPGLPCRVAVPVPLSTALCASELPAELAARLAEIETRRAAAADQPLGVLLLEANGCSTRDAAALLARELGVTLFELSFGAPWRWAPRPEAMLARILREARSPGAALLVTDLALAAARSDGFGALALDLLEAHAGLVFLPASDRTVLDPLRPGEERRVGAPSASR
jgi:hypothetical protein